MVEAFQLINFVLVKENKAIYE